MKNALRFFFCLLVMSPAFFCGHAQAGQQGNLETLIDRYSSQHIRALNKESGARHKVSEKKIFYSDMDRDGDPDAIVEIAFCEAQRCEATTQTSNMALFLKSKRGYRFAAGKKFVKFNDDNSIELLGKIESVKNAKIHLAVYGCEVDDKVCLPKFLYRTIYSFKRNRFLEVKA